MPSDWDINLAGQQGITGPTGPSGFADAPVDGYMYARLGASWATQGAFGGPITITYPTGGQSQSVFTIVKPASGTVNQITAKLGTAGRWAIQMGNATAESGSNAGSDLAILRFNDAGVYIDTPLTIYRSNGQVVISTSSGNTNPLALSVPVGSNALASGIFITTHGWIDNRGK